MTDMHKSDGVMIKSDGKGRMRTPAARRERLLDEFERSGLTGTKFAALAGVKYQTFAAWAQRRRQQRTGDGTTKLPVAAADKVRWLEAVIEQRQVPEESCRAAVVVQLANGARLEIADAGQAVLAAAFVRALEQPIPSC